MKKKRIFGCLIAWMIVVNISGIINAQALTSPSETYGDLLHLYHSNLGADSTLRIVYDGLGNATALKLSKIGVGFPSPFTLGATSVTVSAAELNYSVGVTSSIQNQLNSKVSLSAISSTALGISWNSGTGVISWSSGFAGLADSMRALWSAKQPALGFTAADNDSVYKKSQSYSKTETNNLLGAKRDTTYLNGITSNVQTQINNKQASLGFTPVDKADSTDGTSYTTKKQFNDGQLLDVKKADSTGVHGYATQDDLLSKQATLISATNIKTINGNSILGSGDLTIASSGNATQFKGKDIDTTGTADGKIWVYRIASNTWVLETKPATSGSPDWTDVANKPANVVSLGSLANASGWLKNNGSGTLSYSTPTKSDVSLSAVTNNAQIKKLSSSTANNVPRWANTSGDSLAAGLVVGTSANDLVQLDGNAKLPAVDGSQLTNLPAGSSIVRKTSPEIVNNSTTYQDDNQLTLAVAASKSYLLEIHLLVVANTTSKFKCKLTYPSGTTFIAQAFFNTTASSSFDYFTADQSATDIITGNPQTNGLLILTVQIITSTTAGSITLQWAQATAEVYNTQVYTDSWMRLTLIQ